MFFNSNREKSPVADGAPVPEQQTQVLVNNPENILPPANDGS